MQIDKEVADYMEDDDLFELIDGMIEPDAREVSPQTPFDPSKIALLVKQPTIDNLMKRILADPSEIDLKTTFQRKEGLWNTEQKSKLIESLLLRIPLPAFYFDGTDDDKWLVVDGLQRLHTFYEFIGRKDDGALKLQGLEYLFEYENFTFQELPRNMQRRIEETQVTAYIIQPGTPGDVKFNIFKRINTGGLPLSPQEIRHALNQGISADYLKKLADNPVFVNAIGKISKERMEDREIVLRFLAFYINGYELYEPDMDAFLNDAMGELGLLPEDILREYETVFVESMSRAKKIFEKFIFRKIFKVSNNKIRRGPLNKALFDVWSVLLAKMDGIKFNKLLSKKEFLINEFIILLKDDNQFERSITSGTGGKYEVNTRFSRINGLVERVLNS